MQLGLPPLQLGLRHADVESRLPTGFSWHSAAGSREKLICYERSIALYFALFVLENKENARRKAKKEDAEFFQFNRGTVGLLI